MSYLAYSTYPNGDENNSSDDLMEVKRQKRDNSKTFKKRDTFTASKEQELIKKMHMKINEDDEEELPSPPKSASMERLDNQNQDQKQNQSDSKESMVNLTSNNDIMFRTLGKSPQPNYEGGNYDLNDYTNYGDEKSNEEYYKRVIPGYSEQKGLPKNTVNKPYYSQVNYNIPDNLNGNDNVLLQKMNYMITLLEDQQDERTNNVTEEVVLYSFLGIFIIFIADTFVRAGKYVR
jgi:hypothetical protein